MRSIVLAVLLSLLPIAGAAQVGNGSGNPAVSANQAAAMAGLAYQAGSSMTSVALGANLRYLFSNPANSGYNCLVYELQAYGNGVAATSAHIWYSPTTGLPTTARPAKNLNTTFASTASVCTAQADAGATAVSGGIDTGVDLPIPTNTFLDIVNQTYVVGPGTSIGINVPFAVAAQGTLNIFWRQTPVGGS